MRISKDPEERKAEIIAVARRLFEQYGVEHTKISDIVGAVGVAQGLFYYYFHSKGEVIRAVAEQLLGEVDSQIHGILCDASAGFCEKLRRYIELYAMLLRRFHVTGQENSGILSKDLRRRTQRRVLEHLHTLTLCGVQEGALRLRYPERMVTMLFYGMTALLQNQEDPLDMESFFVLLEQGLGLPAGALSRSN